MAVTITGSVGFGGKNNLVDVGNIQTLLNKWIDPKILVTNTCTGKIDDPTVIAIKKFQSTYSSNPDGRVDVGGGTLRRLNSVPFSQLPQVLDFGYYSYGDKYSDKQWGTEATIGALIEVSMQFHLKNPTLMVGIGNISYQDGSVMKPHVSHRNGKNADIRPCRNDQSQSGVRYTDTVNYNQDKTKELIEAFLAHKNVKYILFNDPDLIRDLKGVIHHEGHNDHFHIQMKD